MLLPESPPLPFASRATSGCLPRKKWGWGWGVENCFPPAEAKVSLLILCSLMGSPGLRLAAGVLGAPWLRGTRNKGSRFPSPPRVPQGTGVQQQDRQQREEAAGTAILFS